MITRICVSPVAGWLVGIGVPPSVGCRLGDAAGSAVGVGGTVVGATVDGELVGTATVTVGVGDIADSGDVGVGVGAQAAIKIAAKMSTII
jgi:hypothetical protein